MNRIVLGFSCFSHLNFAAVAAFLVSTTLVMLSGGILPVDLMAAQKAPTRPNPFPAPTDPSMLGACPAQWTAFFETNVGRFCNPTPYTR